ncbi:MAG: flagellar filament capping protein FliD [Bacteroidota bacterium]
MSTISASAVRGDDPYEMLIKSIISIESQPKLKLTEEKGEQQRMKSVMSDFSKLLTQLQTAVKNLSDPVTTLVGARKATTDATAFAVTASDRADLGSHTLEVLRLASADSRVSRQFSKAGTELAAFTAEQSFAIEVFSPTAEEPERRVAIDVSVTPTGTTDAEILEEVQTAIKSAFKQAATDGLIKNAEAPSIALVNETSDTARLSIRSASTGFDGRLSFVDSADGFLTALQVNSDALVEGTSGGQSVAVGTSETDSMLNAQFVLNGLTLLRSSNHVTDALAGVTIDLRRVSNDGPASFTVGNDNEAITSSIEDFIKKYNEVLGYIEKKSRVDGEANTRGDFAGESSIRGLRMAMRNDMVRAVGGVPGHSPQSIDDLGIVIERDGTLTLKDADKLAAAISDNPDGVQAFIGGTDGIAKRIEERLSVFVGASGILSERQKSFDARIKRIDTRIKSLEDQLTRREDSLRMQFAKMQEAIANLQGQQSAFMSYLGYY